ncbi:MAG: ATP-binding protein [Thiobacillus sp.]
MYPGGLVASGAGTGLGRDFVRTVAVQHGRTVAVESEPKGATRFALWLPLDSTAAQ